MMIVQYTLASAPPRPSSDKLGVSPQSSSVASNYHDSADWSQIRVIPLVEIDPLDPPTLASRAVPQAAESRSPHWRKLLKRTYGTAKIRIKRSKSGPQRGAAREPRTKFLHFEVETTRRFGPQREMGLVCRNPASEIRRDTLVRIRPRDPQPIPTSDNVESV
jgi:hypothetical protein